MYVDVSGGEIAAALVLDVSIGDGGQFAGGTNGGKPVLRDARLTGTAFHSGIEFEDLVFSHNSLGEPPLDSRLFREPPTYPPSGYVVNTNAIVPEFPDPGGMYGNVLEGRLAALLIDTTGLPALPVDQLFPIRAVAPYYDWFGHSDEVATRALDPLAEDIDLTLTDGLLRIRGTGAPEPAATPEPSTLALAGIGLALAAFQLRRGRSRWSLVER